MEPKQLSPREEEIINLSVEGLSNEDIAQKLDITLGALHTSWLRIKLKVNTHGKTKTLTNRAKNKPVNSVKIVDDSQKDFDEVLANPRAELLESRAALALFHFAMGQISSTVWATDRDLVIHILANGETPSLHSGVKWEVGKTVYDIFKTKASTDLAIAAHMQALEGQESETRLSGKFSNMILRVMPLTDEAGENMGSISILNIDEADPTKEN